MSRLRAMLLLCGALAAGTALGASPDPKDLVIPPEELSKARELVKRLGNEDYRGREEAQAELAKMGRAARQALLEGATTDPDAEIRSRSIRLLPKAEADDLKARVDTFLEDKDAKFEHNLPGLKTFRTALKNAPKSRDLYVEILKSPYNLEMFAAMDRSPAEGGKAVSDRRNTLYGDMIQRQFVGGRAPTPPKQPSLADVAAVLFAESQIPFEHIPRTVIQWQQVSGVLLFNQSASMQALNGSGPHTETYKLIVAKWLGTRDDPRDLEQLVYQIGNGNLRQFPEANGMLRRIVIQDGVQGYAKGQALNFIIQQKGKEEVPFLKALVRNEVRVGDYPEAFKKGENPDKLAAVGADAMVTQVWFQRNPNAGIADMHAVTLRDIAFAYLLTQNGLNMRDFGFETQPNQNFNPTPAGFGQYAFTSDEKRRAAFVKFGWHQLKQSLKDPNDKTPAPKDPPPPPPPPGRPVKDAPVQVIPPGVAQPLPIIK
ncbi:MAG: hypothetical protein ACKODX_19080 [Gemmata sp.]